MQVPFAQDGLSDRQLRMFWFRESSFWRSAIGLGDFPTWPDSIHGLSEYRPLRREGELHQPVRLVAGLRGWKALPI